MRGRSRRTSRSEFLSSPLPLPLLRACDKDVLLTVLLPCHRLIEKDYLDREDGSYTYLA